MEIAWRSRAFVDESSSSASTAIVTTTRALGPSTSDYHPRNDLGLNACRSYRRCRGAQCCTPPGVEAACAGRRHS
jgi:hypothetical protein